jgi:hypothetical protein
MRKRFFKERTAQEIRRLNLRTITTDLIEEINSLKESEGIIINRSLIPMKSIRKFMKHGQTVNLRRFESIDELIEAVESPWEMRKEAFDNIHNISYSGYCFQPVDGNDRRIRKISLVDCLEGARIFAYIYQENEGFIPLVDIKPYDKAKAVELEGADVHVMIPSKEKKSPRYSIKIMSVPIIDNKFKTNIALRIHTDHACNYKKFNIRYLSSEKESICSTDKESRLVNFCAHDIAAYLAVIDYYKKDENSIPLKQCPFAIPTQSAVDFYKKLCNQVLIRNNGTRKLSMTEKGVLLFGDVYKNGHDKKYFPFEKVKEYDWNY